MLDLTGTPAIDVLIGLAFFYFLFSIVCSAVNEGISTLMNYRAKDLEKGISNLLDGKSNASVFYDNPRVRALFKGDRLRDRIPLLKHVFANKLPSYIPPRVFALTVLDTFAPPTAASQPAAPPTPTDAESYDLFTRAKNALAGVVSSTAGETATSSPQAIPDRVITLLQDAVDEAEADVQKLRTALENAFNEAMDRVSGWYKRRVQLILFIVALIVVGFTNADSYAIGKTLWQNDAVRSAVVQAASKTGATPACAQSGSDEQKAASCVAAVKQLGLPLGWSKVTSPSGWGIAGKIGGLLLTAFAILLGAPFWFDTLSKLAGLRGAGKSPDDKNSSTKPATS
jgi:hypothetical protein